MPKIYLVEGPVGAGKSTYCKSLAARTGGVHIALDEWFSRLFSPDRPSTEVISWYIQRKERLVEHIWNHAQALLASGASPILELGLIERQSRERIYERARDAKVELSVYFLDAPREVRRQRVARRNVEQGATFSMVVPEAFFEMASDAWQPPDDDELSENCFELVST